MAKTILEALKEKVKLFPKLPGTYLMKDIEGRVIYVGKAKDLRSRVMSYFNNSSKSIKTEILVSRIRSLDFIVTDSESEALVLEINLIKEHSPRYNIRLKDDKSYPYIAVDRNEPFPRLQYKRRIKKKKNVDIFGPFVDGSKVSYILRILTKSFLLRDCSLHEFYGRKNPCILYQMDQCSAPCVGLIDENDYEKKLNLAVNFLKGSSQKALSFLRKQMEELADEEKFEQAAIVRDNFHALEEFLPFSEERKVDLAKGYANDLDVFAAYFGEKEVDISVLNFRDKILVGKRNYNFHLNDFDGNKEEEFSSFILQYYENFQNKLPQLILVPELIEDLDLLQKALENSLPDFEGKVKNSNGKFKGPMEMAAQNAKEFQKVRLSKGESLYDGLEELRRIVGLKERPRQLECYDVAIWQGSSPTASKISFNEGKPDKGNYRFYHLEKRPELNNDFAMMEEALERRIKEGNFPDLLVVDGGKGQLNKAHNLFQKYDIDIPLISLAKPKVLKKNQQFHSKDIGKSEERIFLIGKKEPVLLKSNSSLFRILVQMRDEAHRFSRKLHHKEERKRVFKSWLDDIPGVGPKTKVKILRRLNIPKEELAKMTIDEIKDYLEIGTKLAEKIKKALI